MGRFLAGFTFAVVLLGLGWSAGRAQSVKAAQSDFGFGCGKEQCELFAAGFVKK